MTEKAKRHSLRQLVNAKCRECIYDPTQSGTWKKQVEDCTSTSCSLYVARPVSSPTSVKKLAVKAKES